MKSVLVTLWVTLPFRLRHSIENFSQQVNKPEYLFFHNERQRILDDIQHTNMCCLESQERNRFHCGICGCGMETAAGK